jgi:hypothetical protein
MAGKNLLNLAKSSIKPKEDDDIIASAKEKVAKLANSVVSLTNTISQDKKEDDDILELEVENKTSTSVEWLSEQVTLLSSENDRLRKELANNITDINVGSGSSEDSYILQTYQNNILSIFNELQSNFLGFNPERSRYMTVNIDHILNLLITNFPELNNYKRF